MDTKHTAGPLETAAVNAGYFADEPSHVTIVGPLPHRHIIARVYGRPEQAKADARLYAAAPDLLEALDDLEAEASAEIDPNTSLNLAILKARAAIAKATGGTE